MPAAVLRRDEPRAINGLERRVAGHEQPYRHQYCRRSYAAAVPWRWHRCRLGQASEFQPACVVVPAARHRGGRSPVSTVTAGGCSISAVGVRNGRTAVACVPAGKSVVGKPAGAGRSGGGAKGRLRPDLGEDASRAIFRALLQQDAGGQTRSPVDRGRRCHLVAGYVSCPAAQTCSPHSSVKSLFALAQGRPDRGSIARRRHMLFRGPAYQ